MNLIRHLTGSRVIGVAALAAYVLGSAARWLVAPEVVRTASSVPLPLLAARPTGDVILLTIAGGASVAMVLAVSAVSRIVFDLLLFFVVRYHGWHALLTVAGVNAWRLDNVRRRLPNRVIFGGAFLWTNPVIVAALALSDVRTFVAIVPLATNAALVTTAYVLVATMSSTAIAQLVNQAQPHLPMLQLVAGAIALTVILLAALRWWLQRKGSR